MSGQEGTTSSSTGTDSDQISPQTPENTVATEDKDLELALALSLSESKQNSEELKKNGLAPATMSEDEDLELALALSLSEIKQKSEEEKEELAAIFKASFSSGR